eukprot:TRINITY_DN378_c0_g1_i1.p1 TRINITY_DN378_c0_g1~~TRINITY_DN378_c0_g1_i1.p1  ORF type:complete len:403 (+),score=78.88 TRINITY_DN378_c0_g1_i1:316-1524(+)
MCFAFLSWLLPGLFSSTSSSESSSNSNKSGKTNLADLVREMTVVSERAATIARACRAEKALFHLLVEEKKEDSKNARFVQDFKTLADVLIQETVRYYLANKYPDIAEHLFGEETATFTNGNGDSVTVTVNGDRQKTRETLEIVLGGGAEASTAAQLLTDLVYSNINVSIPDENILSSTAVPFSPSEIGVWIDPIDGTNEYVKGDTPAMTPEGIFPGGLPVVTVLIGAYNRATGEPVAGVINQPFWKVDPSAQGGWRGRCVWGFSKDGVRAASKLVSDAPNIGKSSLVVMSSSEDKELKEAAAQKFTILKYPAGAGYKLMAVIEGASDAYILSKGSTFKWDTCGPHAILLGRGGGVTQPDGVPLRYHQPDEGCKGAKKWSNSKGLVAWVPPTTQNDLTSLWKK